MLVEISLRERDLFRGGAHDVASFIVGFRIHRNHEEARATRLITLGRAEHDLAILENNPDLAALQGTVYVKRVLFRMLRLAFQIPDKKDGFQIGDEDLLRFGARGRKSFVDPFNSCPCLV